MTLIKTAKTIDSVLSLHTDMQHNARPKHKMLHMSHAGAAPKESEVSGLGLMKGERQSSGQGQVKQWLRCTNLSDKLLLLSAQDLTLLSSLRLQLCFSGCQDSNSKETIYMLCLLSCIHSHMFKVKRLLKHVGLELIPADTGQETWCTLDKLPVHHRAGIGRQKVY